jgi:hypothetical protein
LNFSAGDHAVVPRFRAPGKPARPPLAAFPCQRLNSIGKFQYAAVSFRLLKRVPHDRLGSNPSVWGQEHRAAAKDSGAAVDPPPQRHGAIAGTGRLLGRQAPAQLQNERRSISDNDIDVTNAGGDQDYRQKVHWHIVSGMVADLIGDCERRRRKQEMGGPSCRLG